jgi:tetratricopeptide (TPR) repeat protein
MPVDWSIERPPDGSITAWMSEHDPLNRLKGMHGVRLTPDSALIEVRVRLFNRTPYLQTFLWWANAAVKVHDQYQSFFPPDVHYVADHAKRAVTTFPLACGRYYGVDYTQRSGANDLTWYKNIPVPTSYMVVDSDYGFLGGFDYRTNGGFVQVADPFISPGKKQWTWGNAPFGQAWDRELCDDGAPYIELMGGVYTDNQPDFSYLHPYESRTFSQFWWPIREIGPVQNANRHAAIRFVVHEEPGCEVRLVAPRSVENGRLMIEDSEGVVTEIAASIQLGRCWQTEVRLSPRNRVRLIRLLDSSGRELIRYQPDDERRTVSTPEAASEPRAPAEIASADELFLVGEHLEQYRHPTRDPENYWLEAIKRDPGDYRCLIALGRRCIARYEFRKAAELLSKAIKRLCDLHPNPLTGEAHYYYGLALRFCCDDEQAEKAFAKAAWDRSWTSASKYELALLACRRQDFTAALDFLQTSPPEILQNNLAAVLQAIIIETDGDRSASTQLLEEVLQRDPLDHWAAYELARQQPSRDFGQFLTACRNDAQTILDLAFNYMEAGFFNRSIELLELHKASPLAGTATPNPGANTIMTDFVLAWLYARIGQLQLSATWLGKVQQADPTYLFPSRAFEAQILEWATLQPGFRTNAAYGLGNLYYDRRRHTDAIGAWELGVVDAPHFAPLFRNLGLAYWNQLGDENLARKTYERAVEAAPDDARLAYEYDQLQKKLCTPPDVRLRWSEKRLELVLSRDDFCVEYLSLLNLTERHPDVLALTAKRRFHPWEGGEGKVLAQYRNAQIALGREALEKREAAAALEHFTAAHQPPVNLGEEFHHLQSRSDLNYWKGRALTMLGREQEAQEAFIASGNEAQDFKEMAVTVYSSFTYYRGLSLLALGRDAEAKQLFAALRRRGQELQQLPGKIDYFATSLPNMLVFEEDLTLRNQIEGKFLEGLALLQLGEPNTASDRFLQVLDLDPSHYEATAQLRALTIHHATVNPPESTS